MNNRKRYTTRSFTLRTWGGQCIDVHQATSADVGLAGVPATVSERALHLRFMRSAHFSADMLWQEAVRMTHGHAPERTTLVATMRRNTRDECVAVAELVRYSHDTTLGEIALVVRDDLQKQGIGSALLWRLVTEAQRAGITRLKASMLAENGGMFRLIRSMGLPYTARSSYGETEVLISLPGYRSEPLPAQSPYTFAM
ncbi:MAG TPA: GNAT family N-acetyltransferase [Roseiflexaceae bacterium]|nr:GNAT family N-acetyltransferase [Roseiflexaceae bacterium]